MRSNVVKFKDGATTYNSVADWGFTLTHCDEQKPAPKFERIDVPGANGSVDVSTALRGDIPFKDREVELTFFKNCSDHDAAFALANTVASAIHGKQMDIQTPDSYEDGDTWYSGDVEITECRFDDRACEIDVKAVCGPFRIANTVSSLSLNIGTSNALTAAPVLELANNEFNTPGLQFDFNDLASTSFHETPVLGALYARSDNLFDLDLTNLRGKTVKTGESWQKSNVISQDGQTIDFGAVNLNWCERAVVTATNATANISNVRLPFSGNTHCYVFIHADEVTAKGNVTIGGVTRTPEIDVRYTNSIGSDIGDNGITTTGTSGSFGGITNITLNASIDAVVDCGVVSPSIGQIAIDVIGITSANVTAQIMFVKDGVSVSQWVEPLIEVERVTLPQPLERKLVSGSQVMDTYKSTPPFAQINKQTAGTTVNAQSFKNWPRDTKYCEFASIDNSGWVMDAPQWNAAVTVWSTQTGTADTGAQPAYPSVVLAGGWYGVVVIYNDVEHIVNNSLVVQLDTPLNRGENTVKWVRFNEYWLPAPYMTWPVGKL